MHVPWSVRALEAGKHVLAEKPLTRRPEEAEAAFDAAEAAGRVLAEGFMWRHTEQTRRLRELLAAEAVGPLRVIRANFSFDIFGSDRPDDVRLQAALDGGSLMDVGCYCVSAMRLLGGEPESVSGRQVMGGDGVDIRFAATLALPGDVIGVLECGIDMVARHELELVGTAGTIGVADPWHQRSPRIVVRRAGGDETIDFQPSDAYAAELEDFAAAARGERPHPFGRADAVAQARTIAALYAAAEQGADVAPARV
jgi:predicted dehydrogenase